MKKFLINVNGTAYNVEVEEVRDGIAAAPAAPRAAAPVATAPVTATPVSAAAPTPKAAPVAAEGAVKVNAPMPGTILGIKVAPGDTVKKGTVLLILEAMKMENEIMSAGEGTVVSVAVNNGDSVSTGQLLVVLN